MFSGQTDIYLYSTIPLLLDVLLVPCHKWKIYCHTPVTNPGCDYCYPKKIKFPEFIAEALSVSLFFSLVIVRYIFAKMAKVWIRFGNFKL